MRLLAVCAFSLLMLVLASACTVTSTTGGALDVQWTVAGVADPNECTSIGAQSVSITLVDSAGVESGSTVVSCGSLSTSFLGLSSGTYEVNGSLLDVNGSVLVSTSSVVSVLDSGTSTDVLAFEAPIAGAGSLTVAWTVAGSASSSACAVPGADSIEIDLFDASGNPVGDAETFQCSEFSASITNLPAGTYSLTAQLFDANGAAVTTQASTSGIAVGAGQDTSQTIDFPTSSFQTGSTAGTGSIAVTWTLEEDTATASCGNHNASSISLQLYEADGVTPVGEPSLVSCVAFSATLTSIAPGSYTLGAQLVNAVMSVSTAIPPQPVTVTSGGAAALAFDFPASSF